MDGMESTKVKKAAAGLGAPVCNLPAVAFCWIFFGPKIWGGCPAGNYPDYHSLSTAITDSTNAVFI